MSLLSPPPRGYWQAKNTINFERICMDISGVIGIVWVTVLFTLLVRGVAPQRLIPALFAGFALTAVLFWYVVRPLLWRMIPERVKAVLPKTYAEAAEHGSQVKSYRHLLQLLRGKDV